METLVSLYHGGFLNVDPKRPEWTDRDRFVLSKGQASPALYCVLADLGFFDPDELNRFAQRDGTLGVHLQKSVPGVELTVGSLGQAYGIAVGMALAARMDLQDHYVVALLGDGECYEGSIWEAAMFAAHHRLGNLITIVDRNGLCVTDFTEQLVALEPLAEKWRSFGFNVLRVPGHDCQRILEALAPLKSRYSSGPTVIIAETVKGQGLPELCYHPIWHGRAPQGETARRCLEYLATREI